METDVNIKLNIHVQVVTKCMNSHLIVISDRCRNHFTPKKCRPTIWRKRKIENMKNQEDPGT